MLWKRYGTCSSGDSCGTVALMVLGQFSDICGPHIGPQISGNWSRTIRAMVPQLVGNETLKYMEFLLDLSLTRQVNINLVLESEVEVATFSF
jgi:hypothetical protein